MSLMTSYLGMSPTAAPAPLGLDDAEPGLWIVVCHCCGAAWMCEDAEGQWWVITAYSERDLRGVIRVMPADERSDTSGRCGMTTRESLEKCISAAPSDARIFGWVVFDESGAEITRRVVSK